MKRIFALLPVIHLVISLTIFPTVLMTSIYRSEASPVDTSNPFPAIDPRGLSPFWDWKMIETENFQVIFPSELREIANRAGIYLEEAHSLLSPVLRWQPHYKTQVLVIDNSDAANGLTVPFGRIGITLWATPPESWSSTSYYDDWLRLLVIHEYTHFLNMDATRGYATVGRVIFGDAFLPNSLWMPWMLEGLAVTMETHYTSAGRGRSPYYEMVLRAAVEEQVINSRAFVTLDKLNGANPYFPGGDTRYLFGYYLMNQASGRPEQHGQPGQPKQEDLLGILSERSSGQIPFFINPNLENVIGKDWYQLWAEVMTDAEKRAQQELQTLRAQPITQPIFLTQKDHEISNVALGAAVSKDGNWLAYSLESADRRPGLYLRNLKTGEDAPHDKRLDDKLGGIGMKFTPDSKALIYSELRRKALYYTYSDLRVYLLNEGTSHPLTDLLRARDPDISQDGEWVTFAFAENATTGLARARLISSDHDIKLGPIEKLFIPPQYDHVANPQFSKDGKQIYFSLHPNGKSQEDLVSYSVESGKITPLIVDGFYNQFPAVDPQGNLYFVSTKTGVHNIYRYQPKGEPELVTNTTTGILSPVFASDPQEPGSSTVYASVFSSSGWGLAKIKLLEHPIPSKSVTIQLPSVSSHQAHQTQPPPSKMVSQPVEKTYPVQDYSILPSILPRAWSPLLGWDANGLTVGAQLFGFDSVYRHRYLLAGSYSTQLKTADGYMLYSNQSLGPELSVSSSYLTSVLDVTSSGAKYARLMGLSAHATLPILWTYSSLTPTLGFNMQRALEYQTEGQLHSGTSSSPWIPTIDGSLRFSSQESSPLSISYEGGRLTRIGTRAYLLTDNPVWKGFFLDREYIRIGKHTVLSPSIRGLWSSSLSSSYPYANALLTGRNSQSILNYLSGDSFDQLGLRGYPNSTFFSKFASVASLDLNFPILRIFGGWGTHPVFLDNWYGFIFAETGYVPGATQDTFFPSTGGGLRLSGEFFSIFSGTFSIEYHQGLRPDLRGASDLFLQVFISAAGF